MNKNLLGTIAIIAIVLILTYCWLQHENRKNYDLGNSQQVFFTTNNYITLQYSPASVYIDEINGNGHTIGDFNTVENQIECLS